ILKPFFQEGLKRGAGQSPASYPRGAGQSPAIASREVGQNPARSLDFHEGRIIFAKTLDKPA
ncbi:MAG: hypothetical protein MJ192_10075, partial [Clostridia bacterium]|nr:hypothetical protein [Clostridia bacterium]